MQPATVKRWHTTAFRLYWRRKSRGRPGRPPLPKEMRDLIHKLSRENPLWSAERIADTLRLLGCDPPCNDTIRKYMSRPKTHPDKPTTWLPFLRNHLEVSWAMDFFTVITVGFSFLYVFVVFEHGRRRVIHLATTYHPSMEFNICPIRARSVWEASSAAKQRLSVNSHRGSQCSPRDHFKSATCGCANGLPHRLDGVFRVDTAFCRSQCDAGGPST